MPTFKCDSPALDKALTDLHALIVEHGGYIDDNVTVLEEEGELSILSSLPHENYDNLIVVPDTCLPRIDDFLLTAHDDKLNAEPETPDVMESHVSAMRLMMEIYNITNKLSKHRETNPWLALQTSPAVMQKLYEARFEAPKIKQYYEQYKSNQFNKLLIDTFIGSRALVRYPGTEGESSRRLIPFIDFMNHYYASPEFQISNNNANAISVRNSIPITGSQECFIHYAMMDAIDSLLLYGFVDNNNTPFVRSIPLQFDLHELSGVKVQACISRFYRGDLPESVKDLRRYIPYVLEGDDSVMQLSHLLIPGEMAPLALRRILTFYIQGWKPGLRQNAVKKIVINAEKLIIRKNLEYYTDLSSILETSDGCDVSPGIAQSIRALADLQMDKLRQYQERIDKLG